MHCELQLKRFAVLSKVFKNLFYVDCCLSICPPSVFLFVKFVIKKFQVLVDVGTVSNQKPVFLRTSYQGNVTEDAKPGTAVLQVKNLNFRFRFETISSSMGGSPGLVVKGGDL